MFKKCFLICFSLIITTSFSQELNNKNPEDEDDKSEFKVMPYVNYNRNLKFMFGALPMVMFKVDKMDKESPKSIGGLLGVYTTNESYFVLGFTQLYLFEDKWRSSIYALTGNMNSQLYLEDFQTTGFYDFSTKTTQVGIEVKRYIFKDWYAGLGLSFAHFNSEATDEIGATDTNQNSINVSLLSDKRDDVYYPTEGHKIVVYWRSFQEWLGTDGSSEKIWIRYNKYFKHKNNVIAARFNSEFGLGDVKFEQQVVIGGKDIRGYSDGKYRGDGLISIQGEYRWSLKERFGLVGFAGLATIYGSPNPEFDWDIYPGVGVGCRYKVFKNSKFNIGLDVAVGRQDWSLSFRIGEAF